MTDTEVQGLLQVRIGGALDDEPYAFLSTFESLPLPIDLLKPSRSEVVDGSNTPSHSKGDANTASLWPKMMEKLYCSPFFILTLRGIYEYYDYLSWMLRNDSTFLNTEEEVFYVTDLLISRAFYRKIEEPDPQFIRLFLHSNDNILKLEFDAAQHTSSRDRISFISTSARFWLDRIPIQGPYLVLFPSKPKQPASG